MKFTAFAAAEFPPRKKRHKHVACGTATALTRLREGERCCFCASAAAGDTHQRCSVIPAADVAALHHGSLHRVNDR